MKLQSPVLIKVNEEEEKCLKQMGNGFNYFTKYYLRLSRFYSGIEFKYFEEMKEFINRNIVLMAGKSESYDMQIWFVILRNLNHLETEYIKNVGLGNCLYLEFIRQQRGKVLKIISSIFAEIARG